MMAEMSGSSNPLTTKFGPLPVWGWAIVLIGGWWAYYLWTGKGSGGESAVPTDSMWVPSDTSSVDLSGQYGESSGVVHSPSLPTGGTPAPQTPQAWASIAADWLIGNGAPASTVQTALAKYISGGALTTQEQALVNQALQHFGTPPGGPIPVTTVPAPSAPPVAKFVIESHHTGPISMTVYAYCRLWSDSTVATPTNIEQCVNATVNDGVNSRWRDYYTKNGGKYPANIIAAFHVVKKG